MKEIFYILFLCMGFGQVIYSQTDNITTLENVYLKSVRIKDSAYTTNVTILSDSVLRQNQASLTNLLNYNSTVYFKENGLGMVSSPSFRGTTASQTAVLWNGININSQTTGQTDFNTINIRGYNKIEVKPGGSSVADGSGAIGGTINLVNQLEYDAGFNNELFFNYGEFNTHGLDYRTSYSSKKLSLMLGVARNGSDNNYPYPETERINSNGHYQNTNISFAASSKLDSKNTLKVFANVYKGRRNFSVPTPNALKTKYTDFNTRSLIEWERVLGKFVSNLKVATTTEEYRYFGNIASDFYTTATVNSLIAKYGLDYAFSNNMLFSLGANYTRNDGQGSDIQAETRNLAAAIVSFKHKISKSVLYEISLRQEANAAYGSPLLYSAGMSVQLTSFYQLKLNTSKNYRIPTYNDLYWQGLGNPNLKPEVSYQGEISNNFKIKNASLSVTAYYNSVKNLLHWIPGSDGIFRPENTNQVQIYGLESILNLERKIDSHLFSLSATYAYTISENSKTQKQLIYVPFHKLTASVGYGFKNFSAYYQYLNNGEVFTTTDNATEHILNSYMVANLGAEYALGKQKKYKLGVQVLNLWDEAYESVQNRPMPGRNFNFYINLIF
ncbi:TonB-dependent receptor plug domain-containing protein [Aequorivita viscosa]|uniref:Iron complex outermembrane recepter protein n=1 Tax=Aequorivita viscosa TaxID=797419 RepID=A0A1M6FWE8_9FLAO|nr:TonB-dependent receptor [Aequorivita viscosa]SDW72465.1 iron complex outermembrane recepter protein [Aequorivita viscosa]SHJ02065.1 iron complex outermembrane recepter protein [Aequorivita viscosa]